MQHICFTESGQGLIKQVLKHLGRREKVLKFFDNLSVGPVTDVCGQDRLSFIEGYFGKEFECIWQRQVEFWNILSSTTRDSLVVWITRRSIVEYTGFLELLYRLPAHIRFSLIDLTDFAPAKPENEALPWPVRGTGELTMKLGLKGMELIQSAEKDKFPSELLLWSRLKLENSNLRSIVQGQLTSVPDDHYDNDILSCMTMTWRKAARVIGECFLTFPGHGEYRLVDDWLLWRRIQSMAEAGTIELAGGKDMWHTEVRRLT